MPAQWIVRGHRLGLVKRSQVANLIAPDEKQLPSLFGDVRRSPRTAGGTIGGAERPRVAARRTRILEGLVSGSCALGPDVFLRSGSVAPLRHGHHAAPALELPDDDPHLLGVSSHPGRSIRELHDADVENPRSDPPADVRKGVLQIFAGRNPRRPSVPPHVVISSHPADVPRCTSRLPAKTPEPAKTRERRRRSDLNQLRFIRLAAQLLQWLWRGWLAGCKDLAFAYGSRFAALVG